MRDTGALDDVAYVGLEVADDAGLDALLDRLAAADVAVEQGAPELAKRRGVSRVHCLDDPSGLPLELCVGGEDAATPFVSDKMPSGFLTGEGGLGHMVARATDPAEMERFYCDLLGFRISDRIKMQISPDFELDLTFLHVNPRHHTIAWGNAPIPKRLHHVMLEVNAMADVGSAYERCVAAGFPIASHLGQHPNDKMFSFYAVTPSGLQVEVGWCGVLIDDATWEETRYDRVSIWGHKPEAPA